MPNLKAKVKKWYIAAAVGLLSLLLLLLFLNLVLYAILLVWQPASPPQPALTANLDTFRQAYPGWSEEDIKTLLHETRTEEVYEYEPFTEFRERPLRGKFVTIDPNGFRFSSNQAPWPPDPKAINVFVFGGSTTFGVGLPDGETIPSYLQQLAAAKPSSSPIAVYNFARPGYFSTQELILFECLLRAGFVPHTAVFIDGLNDFIFSNGQPLVANRFRNFMAGNPETSALSNVPLVRARHWLSRRWNKPQPQPAKSAQSAQNDDSALVQEVVDRWVGNKRMIESLAKAFGVRTVFVWQPVPTYKYDLRYHLFLQSHKEVETRSFLWQHALSCRDGYPLVQDLETQGKLGPNFLWLADLQQDKQQNLYVDHVHYNALFSKEIAGQIYDFLLQNSQPALVSQHQPPRRPE